MPEIRLPDIKLPDVKFRDGRLRDLKMPDIDLRDRLPDVDLSRIALPSALRDMHMPEMSLPDVHMPDVHMPDFSVRDIRAPKLDLSGVDLRSLDPRRIDLSGIDAKRLRQLSPFAKPAPKPASPLPWVVVAAVGGLFAGWWLATSSLTGPKVRQFAAGLRGRIDDWRSPRADWEDVEERTEGFWSSEQGWKQEGSQGSGNRSGGKWGDVTSQATAPWDDSGTAVAVGGTESGEAADSGHDGSSDEVGGTAYEPVTSGHGSGGNEQEG